MISVGIIPSRLGSSRLPKKPLIKINEMTIKTMKLQKENEEGINGLLKVAKGDSYEQDPKVCDKHPDAC